MGEGGDKGERLVHLRPRRRNCARQEHHWYSYAAMDMPETIESLYSCFRNQIAAGFITCHFLSLLLVKRC